MVAKLAFSGILLFRKLFNLINYERIDVTFYEYLFHNTQLLLFPSLCCTEIITNMAAKIIKMVINIK